MGEKQGFRLPPHSPCMEGPPGPNLGPNPLYPSLDLFSMCEMGTVTLALAQLQGLEMEITDMPEH